MHALLRRAGMVATFAAIALIALPSTVSADCTPACGEALEQGLDALGVVMLFIVLAVFVAIMMMGGRYVRKDRNSTE